MRDYVAVHYSGRSLCQTTINVYSLVSVLLTHVNFPTFAMAVYQNQAGTVQRAMAACAVLKSPAVLLNV